MAKGGLANDQTCCDFFYTFPSSNTIEIKSIINPLKLLLEVEEASRKQQRLELKVITVALTKMRFVNDLFSLSLG